MKWGGLEEYLPLGRDHGEAVDAGSERGKKGTVITGKPSSNGRERIGCLGPRLIHQQGNVGESSKEMIQGLISTIYNLNNEAIMVSTIK